MAVVNGTSMMPWLSSVLIQTPIRSIETGSADADPTATPRSLARLSSFASAWSISAGVGTASMMASLLANGAPRLVASAGATLRGADPSSKKPRPRLAASRTIGCITASAAMKRAPMKLAIPA